MKASLTVVTPPAARLVKMEVVRDHLRINQPYDIRNLDQYLRTAIAMVESYTNRSLLNQTLRFTLGQYPRLGFNQLAIPDAVGNQWPDYYITAPVIQLPRAPVSSITGITLGTWGYDDQTLTLGSDYAVDINCEPARVLFYDWFNLRALQKNLSITYVSGYGTDPSLVPLQLVQAVLLITTALYQHRGETEDELIGPAARSLMSPFVEETFGQFYA